MTCSLFDRDPYFMVYESINPINPHIFHPQNKYPVNNHQDPFYQDACISKLN